jgi:hypothetical protein
MGAAIGFGALVIVFAVVLPDVLRSLATFLQTFLSLATQALETLADSSFF